MKFYLNGALYENVDTSQHPQAVEVTPEQAAAIAAGTHTVINRQFVEVVPHTPTLDEVKQSKAAAIEAAYQAELADGIAVTIEGTTYQLAAEDRDQTLFHRDLGLLYAAEKVSAVSPDSPIQFVDFFDNPRHVTTARYFDILAQYGSIIRNLFVQRATLLATVRSASSVEQVENITIQFSEQPTE